MCAEHLILKQTVDKLYDRCVAKEEISLDEIMEIINYYELLSSQNNSMIKPITKLDIETLKDKGVSAHYYDTKTKILYCIYKALDYAKTIKYTLEFMIKNGMNIQPLFYVNYNSLRAYLSRKIGESQKLHYFNSEIKHDCFCLNISSLNFMDYRSEIKRIQHIGSIPVHILYSTTKLTGESKVINDSCSDDDVNSDSNNSKTGPEDVDDDDNDSNDSGKSNSDVLMSIDNNNIKNAQPLFIVIVEHGEGSIKYQDTYKFYVRLKRETHNFWLIRVISHLIEKPGNIESKLREFERINSNQLFFVDCFGNPYTLPNQLLRYEEYTDCKTLNIIIEENLNKMCDAYALIINEDKPDKNIEKMVMFLTKKCNYSKTTSSENNIKYLKKISIEMVLKILVDRKIMKKEHDLYVPCYIDNLSDSDKKTSIALLILLGKIIRISFDNKDEKQKPKMFFTPIFLCAITGKTCFPSVLSILLENYMYVINESKKLTTSNGPLLYNINTTKKVFNYDGDLKLPALLAIDCALNLNYTHLYSSYWSYILCIHIGFFSSDVNSSVTFEKSDKFWIAMGYDECIINSLIDIKNSIENYKTVF